MKEILIFGLSSNQGGIETYLKKIWDNIDHSEFHFNFIDMTGKNNRPCFYDNLISSGARFYKITPRNESFVKNRKDIRELFKHNTFDILHFNVNSLSYIYPVTEALRHNVRVIVHSRNAGTTLSRVTTLFHYINRWILDNLKIDRIAVSELAGKWLFLKQPFKVYNNGIDITRYMFDSESRNLKRKEIGCENKYVIGNVGAFLPAKNHRFILKVFSELVKINDKVVLWLIGAGENSENIKALAKELKIENRVYFLGRRNDTNQLYSGMDCFFFPSIYEGFPNALLEAECSGLPCVASDRITSQVFVTNNNSILSLEEPIRNWANALNVYASKRDCDRVIAAEMVEKKGLSLSKEIKRIEELYSSEG